MIAVAKQPSDKDPGIYVRVKLCYCLFLERREITEKGFSEMLLKEVVPARVEFT